MTTSWIHDRERYQALAGSICPVARVTTKDHPLWRAAAWAIHGVSLGRLPWRAFLEDYATTFGPWQAYPRGWSEIPPYTIVHESRHTKQFLRAGWCVPVLGWLGPRFRVWAGVLPMAVLYLCFPLPLFLSWGRAYLELDADAAAWRAALEQKWMTPDDVRDRAEVFARSVSGWSYLRAWPLSMTRKMFRRKAERLIASMVDAESRWDGNSPGLD